MAIRSQVAASNNRILNISLSGVFNFKLRAEFRKAYEEAPAGVNQFDVDLSQVSYIDSSGLGMLLILKEKADELEGRVVLKNPNPDVAELLKLSNFSQIFTIES